MLTLGPAYLARMEHWLLFNSPFPVHLYSRHGFPQSPEKADHFFIKKIANPIKIISYNFAIHPIDLPSPGISQKYSRAGTRWLSHAGNATIKRHEPCV